MPQSAQRWLEVVVRIRLHRRLCSTSVSFVVIAGVMFAGPLPHAEPEEGRWRDRLRAGLTYVTVRVP